jgi:hypothetical protein
MVKLDNIAALAAERASGCRDRVPAGAVPFPGSSHTFACVLPRAEGRVDVWTEERRSCDQRGAYDERASREPKGASMSGLRSEELATSDEGRHRLRAPGGERDQQSERG